MNKIIQFCKDRSKLNLVLDALMLMLMMAIAGIGFLMKFILLPGYLRNEVYGKNVDLYFLNLDRHQWGKIHLILSIAFLLFLLLHIILHWKVIVCVFSRMVPGKIPRIIFVFLFCFFN